MKAIITVLDAVTETSMPFNEFVLYRANHYKDDRQILVVCGPERELPKADIPQDLKIVYVGNKLGKIRRTLCGIIKECNSQQLPYAVHLHQVKSALLTQIAMLGTGFRSKTLFTVHNTFTGYSLHNKVLSFLNACFARQISCVSKTAYKYFPGLVKAVKGDRIRPIQNGVDTERIDKVLEGLEPAEKTDGGVCFVYVARMVPVKNHEFLIDVLKRSDERARLVFIGAEDPEGKIRRLAAENGVEDRIEFAGLIPRRDVFARLSASDVYISSSVLEGLPVSVLEAMYCALPCILSDIPQHIEAAEGMDDSVSLLPLEADRWAAEINRYVLMTGEERKSKGIANRDFVANRFSLEQMHKGYDEIYSLLR